VLYCNCIIICSRVQTAKAIASAPQFRNASRIVSYHLITYRNEALKAFTVSPIVILNKNTVRRKKSMENSTKRTHSSTSINSPIHEEKKRKFFVTPNRFQVLATEEHDNVFVQTESQLVSQTTKTSPEPSKTKLPTIVLKNVTDFIILIALWDQGVSHANVIDRILPFGQTHVKIGWPLNLIWLKPITSTTLISPVPPNLSVSYYATSTTPTLPWTLLTA